MFRVAVAVAIATSFAAPGLAGLNKPTLFGDGLSPHVDWSFWQNLKPTHSTWDNWGSGWIPEACVKHAHDNNVSPKDFEVFNVHYDDCSTAWTFCRHRSASLSQIDMIDLFGRMPVHERQWVRHLIAVPASGPSAYAYGAEIVIQGPAGTPSVFQHEIGHVVDFNKNGHQNSATNEFRNAIAQDSCVPDNYANSNEVEDYAQISVLSLFEIVTPGGLDVATGGPGWRCLERQKNTLDSMHRDHLVPGGKCDRRWPDSPIVATSARVRRAPVGPPPRRDGPVPPEPTGPIHRHVYENLVFNETERGKARESILQWQKEAIRARGVVSAAKGA